MSSQKFLISAKICQKEAFCVLLFVLSRGFGDSYGRAGDSVCIWESWYRCISDFWITINSNLEKKMPIHGNYIINTILKNQDVNKILNRDLVVFLHPCCHPSHIMRWWFIWKVVITISLFCLYILRCNQLPATNYI